jgi:hypothetical protein
MHPFDVSDEQMVGYRLLRKRWQRSGKNKFRSHLPFNRRSEHAAGTYFAENLYYSLDEPPENGSDNAL